MTNITARSAAVLLAATCLSAAPLPPNGFVESEQPFLRSALVVSEKNLNRVRRGVLIPLGEGYWACFDPDLLRHAAIWKAPEGEAPLTMDSMAAISYPDGTAKAEKPPMLRGTIISTSPELPGVGIRSLPEKDIRERELVGGKGKVGPLPAEAGKFISLATSANGVVLTYRIGKGNFVRETIRTSGDLIERVIEVKAADAVAIRLDGAEGKITGNDVLLANGGMKHLSIRGEGRFGIASDETTGTALLVPGGETKRSFRIIRSAEGSPAVPESAGFPENVPSPPPFPEKIEVTSPAAKDSGSPIAERPLNFPEENPWNRVVRPTDIAFLSNGDALITTLDGDVWRVENIETETATWSRAACGLFEPMSIAVNAKNEPFVLGRDQITRLEDADGDGFFDVYACASDAFTQTLHSRDYETSLELAEDGSFLIGRSGLVDAGKSLFGESVSDRGTVTRISPDGTQMEILADGLRLPFIGRRADGAIFASDQQGNFIPSSPIHLIGSDKPYLGYEPADFRDRKEPVPPLLWFPYQVNRSGASFATLSEKAFPSLGDAFVHLSWGGRIFPVMTPETGIPFAWKLPYDFDFPILGAASHPLNGRLYAVGIGISGYKPQTPRVAGLAEIMEREPIAAPASLEVGQQRIVVGFRDPLPPGLSLISKRPELDLWNIKRTKNYGSGHYRWDGKPGEHSVATGKLTISENRREVAIEVPPIFRSDILRLKLHLHDTASARQPYDIEIYAMPSDLPTASRADLADVADREQTKVVSLVPGDSKVGKTLFVNYGCVGCHSLDGAKLSGPPLNGIAGRHAGDLDAYLRASILDPAAVIAEGYEPSMPSFAGVIPEQGIEHLIAYLKSLK